MNDYEKATSSAISVDLLLTVHALHTEGKLSFAAIADLLQRKPELVQEEIAKWVEQGVLAPYGKGRGDSFVLSPAVQAKIGGKLAPVRLTPERLMTLESSVLDELHANGTITRASVVSLCGVTPKQANVIIDDICKKHPVSKRGAGRSVCYVWNANGTQEQAPRA